MWDNWRKIRRGVGRNDTRRIFDRSGRWGVWNSAHWHPLAPPHTYTEEYSFLSLGTTPSCAANPLLVGEVPLNPSIPPPQEVFFFRQISKISPEHHFHCKPHSPTIKTTHPLKICVDLKDAQFFKNYRLFRKFIPSPEFSKYYWSEV